MLSFNIIIYSNCKTALIGHHNRQNAQCYKYKIRHKHDPNQSCCFCSLNRLSHALGLFLVTTYLRTDLIEYEYRFIDANGLYKTFKQIKKQGDKY